ncbi:heme oxygenase [Xylographa pallens]|nr:heme oxygenase [Xylographa pallens]
MNTTLKTHPFLQTEIHTTFRSHYSTLQAILARTLPHLVPPNSLSPHPYIHSLLSLAPLYLSLETSYHSISLRAHQYPSLTIEFFRLFPAGVLRRDRFYNDLATLLGEEGEWRLEVARERGSMVEFGERMERAMKSRPHVILAYAWILYLPLLNAGWVKGQLVAARERRWRLNPYLLPAERREERGLEVWCFERGAERMKEEFGRRLGALEGVISEQQRKEVLEEARALLGFCTRLANEVEREVRRMNFRKEGRVEAAVAGSVAIITHELPYWIWAVVMAVAGWVTQSKGYRFITGKRRQA